MKLRVVLLIASMAAAQSAPAQEFTTTRGVQRVPSLDSLGTEASARQAAREAESVLSNLLLDVAVNERERSALMAQIDAVAQKRKSEQAGVDKAKSEFDELDAKYKADYAAFEQKKVEVEADAARQRAEWARLEPLPSAQRDWATVERVNKWASEITARRLALERDRDALLETHAQVEAARTRPEAAKTEAEGRLAVQRDTVLATLAKHSAREAALYAQLKQAVAYMTGVRSALLSRLNRPLESSPPFDEAKQRLRAFETRTRK